MFSCMWEPSRRLEHLNKHGFRIKGKLEGELCHEAEAVGTAGIAAPVLAHAGVEFQACLNTRSEVPENICSENVAIAVFRSLARTTREVAAVGI